MDDADSLGSEGNRPLFLSHSDLLETRLCPNLATCFKEKCALKQVYGHGHSIPANQSHARRTGSRRQAQI